MFQRVFPGDGLVFQPAGSFHTAFVRFPIDALFLDSNGRILRLCHSVPPWRIRRAPQKAAILIELPAGTLARWGVQPDDVLTIEPYGRER